MHLEQHEPAHGTGTIDHPIDLSRVMLCSIPRTIEQRCCDEVVTTIRLSVRKTHNNSVILLIDCNLRPTGICGLRCNCRRVAGQDGAAQSAICWCALELPSLLWETVPNQPHISPWLAKVYDPCICMPPYIQHMCHVGKHKSAIG